MDEAKIIASYIIGETPESEFLRVFSGKMSEGFNPATDLNRVGVINQTTMLADETHAIAQFFKDIMTKKYPNDAIEQHFSDTRDTLCYATNDNQTATQALLTTQADMALVVGGYNSSNTSHLVEMLESKFPTYFISGPDEILGQTSIRHFNYPQKKAETTTDFIPAKKPVKIILTSGASCPDATLEAVMDKILSFYKDVKSAQQVLEALTKSN